MISIYSKVFLVAVFSCAGLRYSNADNSSQPGLPEKIHSFTDVSSTLQSQCYKLNLNAHCSAVCLMKEKKKMKEDGSLNKSMIIKRAIEKMGLELGSEFAADALACAQKYGPYKATDNCYGIEKYLVCLNDVQLKFCNAAGDSTNDKCNTYESNFECQGRMHHWPALFMENFEECSMSTNSTYLRHSCAFKAVGMYNEDNSWNLPGLKSWMKLTFGRKISAALSKATAENTKAFDPKKIFSEATEENAIDVLSEYMAVKRETFFQVCRTITMDFVSTLKH